MKTKKTTKEKNMQPDEQGVHASEAPAMPTPCSVQEKRPSEVLCDDYPQLVDLLMAASPPTSTRLRLSDLRRVLGCRPTGDLLRAYVESSEAEGNDSLALRECRAAFRASEYLDARPWLLHILRFSTILVMARRHRQAAIVKRVASLTSGGQGEGRDVTRPETMTCCSSAGIVVAPAPFFILTVSLIQVATFAYHCVVPSCGEASANRDKGQPCRIPCNSSLIFDPHRRHEVWRYLSYALVHDGFLHLGGNVFFQVALGFPLEVVHSWRPIMLIYVSGLLCGPLAQSVFSPSAYIAGCSSGVYSLQTAHLAHIVANFRDMELVGVRVATLLVLYGNDLYWVVEGPLQWQGQELSYAGHYAGALAGLVVGYPALRTAGARHCCYWRPAQEA
ncbi:protein rhomboid-like [Haemaphysalis longicornis]